MSQRESIRPDRSAGDGIVVDVRDGGVAIFSHGPNPMSLFDPETGRILEVNDAWVALYGYSREEARAMRVQDVSAEPGATSAAVRAAGSTGGAVIPLRWHRTRSGAVFPVELTSGTLRLGRRVLMYAVMHDIGPRVRAEDALARSEARFRSLIETVPVGLCVHRDGRVLFLNACLRAMIGVAPEEPVAGAPLLDFVHPDDRAVVRARVASITERGAPAPVLEERFVRRDGTSIPVEVSGIPFEYDGAPAVLAIVRDVRERKRMEAQLVLADRLASLGRLAASVGHEINNPLAYVLGNVQLLQRELRQVPGLEPETREGLFERLAALEEGATRVRDIVRDLKVLSGGDSPVVGPVDLHRVLDVCANMAGHEVRNRARLVRDYDPSPAWVRGSEARIGQVFLNLLVNAAHAIPEGDVAHNEIRVATRRDDAGRIIVEVRDTGVGIAPEHLERIFEPFFTTKEAGFGTGLGLSISHAIVTALGGTIVAERVAPRGACFRVTFPGAGATSPEGAL